MNNIQSVSPNPLLPEGEYWVRLGSIDYLPDAPHDVSYGWIAEVIIDDVHQDHAGKVLLIRIKGSQAATPARHAFRDHFRCFDYAPELAIGRLALAQISTVSSGNSAYSVATFPLLRPKQLVPRLHQAVDREIHSKQNQLASSSSVRMLALHRDILVAGEDEQRKSE